MKVFFLSVSACLSGIIYCQADELKGRITEKETGAAAVGATIIIDDSTSLADVAGFDGSYTIRNLNPGKHRLKVSSYGLQDFETTIDLAGDQQLDITLKPAIKGNELQGVNVLGTRIGNSENTARSLERNADQVMNIISGKAIQLSPDLTVANVIQRVSGISIERNSNGDGQFAILRGMDKRYNYTLVNGIKIPSPDNKYRYVPLDIFPSDLLDRLEVYKALTPSLEGDAIGGAINMVMKDAPDDFTFSANLSGGYNELFMNRSFNSYDFKGIRQQSPYERFGNTHAATASDFSKAALNYKTLNTSPNLIGGFSVGNRFLDKRLGILLAGSYQNSYRGSNSTFYDIEKVDTFSGATLTKYSERYYSEQQIRTGLHLKSDFRINEHHKLQWYNAYLNLNNIQVREVNATQLTIGGYDPAAGNATLNFSTRSRLTRQNIFNSTLQGSHQLSKAWKFNWSGVYSVATQALPENTTIPVLGVRNNFADQKTYPQDASRRWEHNTDRDLAFYGNIAYEQKLGRTPILWTLGGLYRDKIRDNFYNQYQMRPANLFAEYGKDYTQYSELEWVVQNPKGSVASALNYGAAEKISAGFLQFNARPDNLDITGGLRVEHTNQSYTMDFPIGEDRPEGEQIYIDFLPSLHFKWMPDRKTNVRASYFKSINRPGFFEIVPYKIVNEEYQERGNPDLKRAIAHNIDLRYEWYPGPAEQLMAGVFYKSIQDPIEYTLQRDQVRGQDIYYAPGNYGTAQNFGVELDAIKYFKKFGIKANYTYTHSAITTDKSKRIRNEQGNLETITVSQTRPLYGQAAHIANLSMLYKEAKSGWDIQLAANYTGERIVTVSQFLDNDFWQKAFVQLDFSLEKSLAKKWIIYAKVNNLLNTPMEVYMKDQYNNKDFIPGQDLNNHTLIRRDYYQRAYLIGLRYKI